MTALVLLLVFLLLTVEVFLGEKKNVRQFVPFSMTAFYAFIPFPFF